MACAALDNLVTTTLAPSDAAINLLKDGAPTPLICSDQESEALATYMADAFGVVTSSAFLNYAHNHSVVNLTHLSAAEEGKEIAFYRVSDALGGTRAMDLQECYHRGYSAYR